MPFDCITQVQASISNEFFKPVSVFTEAVQLTFLSTELECAILPTLARHPLDAQAVFVLPETIFFYFKDHGPGKALINFHLVWERRQFYDRSRISSENLIADDAPFLVLIVTPIIIS